MKSWGDRLNSRHGSTVALAAAIRAHPEVLEALRLFAQSPHEETGERGGFLLGTKTIQGRGRNRAQAVVTVDGFVRACEECSFSPFFQYSKQNASALRRQFRSYSGKRTIVGFFRATLPGSRAVSADDVNLMADQ